MRFVLAAVCGILYCAQLALAQGLAPCPGEGEAELLNVVQPATFIDAAAANCHETPLATLCNATASPTACNSTCAPCNPNRCCCCECYPCECPERPAPCLPCPRVNNLNPSWNLIIGGVLEADFLFNSARPVAAGVPFFLTPASPFGFRQDTFDAHARQTTLFAVVSGPQIGDLKAGGLVMANFFEESVIVDRYGFLPYQAFGELKNEDWRFAAGLQLDIFAPLLPTVLPFSFLAASGNAGVYRGQLRAERFLHPSPDEQITFTVGISDPVATILNNETLSESNGWPDIELRTAYGLGPAETLGFATVRPFEIGVSGVVGQLRTTMGAMRVVDDVWGVAGDFRLQITPTIGVTGEVYTGQALGTYGAAIFQNINTVTFQPVAVSGGWLELFDYFTPCLHSHVGFAVDDPVDSDLAPLQIAANRTIFANLIWDVTKSFRLAAELTFRKTNYIALLDNEGTGFHFQTQWKF